MAAVLFVILFVVPLAAFGAWKIYRIYRVSKVWRRAAADHDLEYSLDPIRGEFRLSGEFRDIPVQIETVAESWFVEQVTTRCTAQLPETFPSDVVIMEDRGTEPVDAPTIAGRFIAETEGREELGDFLERPEVDEAFDILASSERDIEIESGELVLEADYLVEYELAIEDTLETIAEFCRVVRDSDSSKVGEHENGGDAGANRPASDAQSDSAEVVRSWE